MNGTLGTMQQCQRMSRVVAHSFAHHAQLRQGQRLRDAHNKQAQTSSRHSKRERASLQCVQAAPQRSDISTRQAVHKPKSAETARTIVDIVAHGTLCTAGEDSLPLGTYCNYVLDEQGMPVLRLRANAVHTANLLRSPKCSLFVQPGNIEVMICSAVSSCIKES